MKILWNGQELPEPETIVLEYVEPEKYSRDERLALWRYFYKPYGVRFKDMYSWDYDRIANTFNGSCIILQVKWNKLVRTTVSELTRLLKRFI